MEAEAEAEPFLEPHPGYCLHEHFKLVHIYKWIIYYALFVYIIRANNN